MGFLGQSGGWRRCVIPVSAGTLLRVVAPVASQSLVTVGCGRSLARASDRGEPYVDALLSQLPFFKICLAGSQLNLAAACAGILADSVQVGADDTRVTVARCCIRGAACAMDGDDGSPGFKVLVLGDSGVGKTSLTQLVCHGRPVLDPECVCGASACMPACVPARVTMPRLQCLRQERTCVREHRPGRPALDPE